MLDIAQNFRTMARYADNLPSTIGHQTIRDGPADNATDPENNRHFAVHSVSFHICGRERLAHFCHMTTTDRLASVARAGTTLCPQWPACPDGNDMPIFAAALPPSLAHMRSSAWRMRLERLRSMISCHDPVENWDWLPLDDVFNEQFERRWHCLAGHLGIGRSESKEICDYLVAQYNGSVRHYHNAAHIVSMLDGFRSFTKQFRQPFAAQLAIFFHDAIYDARQRGQKCRQNEGAA
jgi:hypothetical protein